MRPLLLFAALTALASVSCYSPGDGQAPPLNELYFPTGLALDTLSVDAAQYNAPKYLYAASSDFDLQYRSSGLISYDLSALSKKIPRNCATDTDCENTDSPICDNSEAPDDADQAASRLHVPSFFCVKDRAVPCGDGIIERNEADRVLYPGRCESIVPTDPFIHSTVGIGAFATDVLFVKSPLSEDGSPQKARLFLPVRGDASMHWIDLDDGNLECDQGQTDDGSCAQSHRAGRDSSESYNNYYQLPEPFAIAATDNGGYLAITNQTTGSVSLYKHDWTSEKNPELVSVIGDLPSAPVAIAAIPDAAAELYTDVGAPPPAPAFLVGFKNAAQIDLVRVRDDNADNGTTADISARWQLTYAGATPITPLSLGYDSRDIIIDDSQRKLDYLACAKSFSDPAARRPCLLAAHQPAVYVTNRTPSSLLVGALATDISYASGTSDLPYFGNPVQLTVGASRVVLGKVKVAPSGIDDPESGFGLTDDQGKYDLEPRLLVICFDSPRVFVYDPKRNINEAVIDVGRGPSALAIDEVRGLAYVAFFTDSYLGVISLDQRFPQNYAAIVASIGNPLPPRTSK